MKAIRLAVLLSLVSCLVTPAARADTSGAPCVLGYTVGFFNGVWNTEADAMDGLQALEAATQEAIGSTDGTYNHEDIGYQLFYNHTGTTVGATSLQDIAEVFIQRANELDSTGYFAQNGLSLFWESFTNSVVYQGPLAAAKNGFDTMLQSYENQVVVAASAALASYFSAPPTAADYTTQNATLDTLAAAGRKFVLVAHSQGNLFINQAYDHIQPVVGSTRVKAVQVAPASPTIRGQYVLSSNDLVINPLRLQGGFSTIQPNNITIPVDLTADASGHTLVATYLDPTRNGRAMVEGYISGAFSALQQSTCNAAITPISSYAQPSQVITLTATVNPPPDDTALNVGYAWSITGNAGGVFSSGSGTASTVNTSTNTVNYITSANASNGQIDTITVKVLVAKTAGDYINVETLGTGTATVTIQPGGLQNGNFTQALAFWTSNPGGGTFVNTQMPNDFTTGASCGPLPEGTPFAQQNTYGSDISLEQTFTVPSNATTLSLLSWNNLDPVQVVVSVIAGTGTETVLGSLQPPSMQKLSDPNNYYSVVCTGNSAATLNYGIQQFAGQQVTLRLRSYYIGGINGTFGNFANVSVH
jgi:hypothetical protein